jgi:transposase-like protein
METTASKSSLFCGRHFDSAIIILCMRWHITYKLACRDLRDNDCDQYFNAGRL